ncbi:MAG TPA: Holliday junction resolvase RuvX [Candidatus Sumerlaeota bacterium]|nr:MAG: putative Holliday junction resolvase [candidate division BRC1 bacterium ADurb.Bin183]HOE64240.1 Holliday junction resolvase RuvX [Candidatus Sumerlaeota bacterium]HRR31038.1 Holliday junction resolvase RuvX [Candidatus Sumerlaeia bacterium]HON50319.1 Holliday junction resolvase RuvX [Candidatus Sumerlaeota bacterium]HOR63535.1 Holliday junction resolvase RuvX [Candidatus Sumerlaeota bacterium]
MGRVLGIDVGEKRIGVAVSDALGITAQPLDVVVRDGRGSEWKRLDEIVGEIKPARAVVGLPLKMNGNECPATDAARQFAKTFSSKHPGIEIIFQDERLTTSASERLLIEAGMRRESRRQKRDIIAATLILETWLRSHKNTLK